MLLKLRPTKCCIAILLLACSMIMPAAANAAAIAIVTDLQGSATVERVPPVHLNITSSIERGSRIRVGIDGKLVLLHLASGDEYVFTGPALILVQPEGADVLEGRAPQKRSFEPRLQIRIDPGRVAQSALVLRSDHRTKAIAPTGKVLGASLTAFRWAAPRAAEGYRFTVRDEDGRSLYVANVQAPPLELPSELRLLPDHAYRWELSKHDSSGMTTVTSANFRIASMQMEQQVESIRPARDAPLSNRVAFAIWLHQLELNEEAREYWRVVSAERPHDEHLKRLAQD